MLQSGNLICACACRGELISYVCKCTLSDNLFSKLDKFDKIFVMHANISI